MNAMPKLMKQMANSYTTYYNRKYKRVGAVMQGRYKSVEVDAPSLPALVRYIHLNPVAAKLVLNAAEYQWSSFGKYLGQENALNLSIDPIMNNFSSREEFVQFHNGGDVSKEVGQIKNLIIEV